MSKFERKNDYFIFLSIYKRKSYINHSYQKKNFV